VAAHRPGSWLSSTQLIRMAEDARDAARAKSEAVSRVRDLARRRTIDHLEMDSRMPMTPKFLDRF
jgi:hypothetical protein